MEWSLVEMRKNVGKEKGKTTFITLQAVVGQSRKPQKGGGGGR